MKRLPTYLEPEELAAVLAAAPPRRRLFYLLCARAGLRVAEAVAVRHEDVQWRDGLPSILRLIGKGDKEALLPLAPSLRALVFALSAPDAEGWLFPGYRNGHHLADRQARYWLVEDAARAGVARHKAHPHALRHSFATHLLREGVNLVEIMDLMRHSSLQITSVYLHTAPLRLQDAVNALDGEILREMAENGERRYGGDESSESVLSLPTLADLNTTKKQSSDAQADKAEANAVVLRHTEAIVLATIRANPGITGEALAAHLSRLVPAVNANLRKLVALGHVIADGNPRRLYAAHDDAVAHVGPREVARYSGGVKSLYATPKAHHDGQDTEEELRLLAELERITRRRLELLAH